MACPLFKGFHRWISTPKAIITTHCIATVKMAFSHKFFRVICLNVCHNWQPISRAMCKVLLCNLWSNGAEITELRQTLCNTKNNPITKILYGKHQ